MYDFPVIKAVLRCPRCHSPNLNVGASGDHIKCEWCEAWYPIAHGRPVLLHPNNESFIPNDYCQAEITMPETSISIWGKVIPSPSINLARRRVLVLMQELLARLPSAMILVVGGGQQRRSLDVQLAAGSPSLQILYTDIDVDADVDLFCDGHDLPFVDGVFDAVVTTAVLEHVLYPERVADEITRVLKEDGLLYSELPFMQQVHEGAYDFTRYTLSGHRRLFNRVREIESGMVAGPGTALVWAVENFALAFMVRPPLRKMAKAVIRLTLGWIKYFDLLLEDKPAAMDGASCTYLLGYKFEGRIPDADIIARYVGAKHLRHT